MLKMISEKHWKEIMECRRSKTIMKMKQYASDSAVYVPRTLVSRENYYFVPGGKAVRRNRRQVATAESAMFGINTSWQISIIVLKVRHCKNNDGGYDEQWKLLQQNTFSQNRLVDNTSDRNICFLFPRSYCLEVTCSSISCFLNRDGGFFISLS